MLGINNRIDDSFTYFEESVAEMTGHKKNQHLKNTPVTQYVKTNKKVSDWKIISVYYGASKDVIDIQSDQNSQFVGLIGIIIKWRRHVELE